MLIFGDRWSGYVAQAGPLGILLRAEIAGMCHHTWPPIFDKAVKELAVQP